MNSSLLFFQKQLFISIKSSFAKRTTFFFEAGYICISNFIFFALWKFFFLAFHKIGTWTFHDMLLLMTITFGAFGLMQVFLGGTKRIAYLILSKDLDFFLLRPHNPLFSILLSKSSGKGWGHLFSSLSLILFSDLLDSCSPTLFFLGLICSFFIFTTIHILLYSLPFWFGQIEELLKKYEESFLLFSLYPMHMYGKTIQILLFSFLPTGLIGCLPLSLIQHFSITNLVLLLGTTLCLISLSFLIFSLGLKKYRKGRALT